jgi:allantoin racemase
LKKFLPEHTGFAMRLLLLNPNISEFVTARVASQARVSATPGTEIVPVTGAFGARVIGTRTELAVAQHATMEALAQHAAGCDAVVLAVSYDTALYAAREMLSIPVVGITEAAWLTACQVGTRTGVVTFGHRVLQLYRELAVLYGLERRIAGWRSLETTAPYSDTDQSEADSLVISAARDLVEREGCDVVVLAGAVMAGVPQRIQPSVPVPLLEGISCAVGHAEMLVRMACPKPATGSLAPLPSRELMGVSEALQAQFGRHRT